jgi:hypothetical protein
MLEKMCLHKNKIKANIGFNLVFERKHKHNESDQRALTKD